MAELFCCAAVSSVNLLPTFWSCDYNNYYIYAYRPILFEILSGPYNIRLDWYGLYVQHRTKYSNSHIPDIVSIGHCTCVNIYIPLRVHLSRPCSTHLSAHQVAVDKYWNRLAFSLNLDISVWVLCSCNDVTTQSWLTLNTLGMHINQHV